MSVRETEVLNVTLGFNAEVKNISFTLQGFAPNINKPGYGLIYMPFKLDDLISRCVKIASQETSIELVGFIGSVMKELKPFEIDCSGQAKTLCEMLTDLVNKLRRFFKQHNFYDDEGSSPWRYNDLTASLGIQLWCQLCK